MPYTNPRGLPIADMGVTLVALCACTLADYSSGGTQTSNSCASSWLRWLNDVYPAPWRMRYGSSSRIGSGVGVQSAPLTSSRR